MLDINIKTIPHKEQRYETIGDWWWSKNQTRLDIRVSDLGDTYKESLIAIHEFVEVMLCRLRGIPEDVVTEFDIQYERNRTDDISEPGDDPKAPYKKEHRFAENIERQLCHEFGISWSEYEKIVYSI